MTTKHVKRENGLYTKAECIGCLYDNYEEWIKADKDTCGVCTRGSEKKPKTINQV